MLKVEWKYTDQAKKEIAIATGEVPEAQPLEVAWSDLPAETRKQLFHLGCYYYDRNRYYLLQNVDADSSTIKPFDTHDFGRSRYLDLGERSKPPTVADAVAEIARCAHEQIFDQWKQERHRRHVEELHKRGFDSWLDDHACIYRSRKKEWELLSAKRRAEIEEEQRRRRDALTREAEQASPRKWLHCDPDEDYFGKVSNLKINYDRSGILWSFLTEEGRAKVEEAGKEMVRSHKQELKKQKVAQRELLRQSGADEPLQRFDAGYLPEKELRGIARDYLFSNISLPKYQRLRESDCKCACYDSDDVSFNHEALYDLTAEEYAAIKKLESQLPEGATMTPQLHWVECASCERGKDGRVERRSARVEIEWAGMLLSRLYAI